ncbi:hypothetical protein [Xenorhabdus hominickii]|uniref:Uncharacterized protein n=1 Tax=Xenorhabdus hominickii TaxID=351679 RepID=A0A2G0Q671_XENHO|nr:hypothetical protein [Xenorhabdus hominickii]AOM39535.1 hypothetical protein A9255_02325 [Xenorhabdus hominickii]PHM54691.1 exported hypothetical protein [Xenorhabdus hominickii]
MKKIVVFVILIFSNITFASENEDLDYCATIESWAASKVISSVITKNQELDQYQATSSFISRHKLVKEGKPITLTEWGQLYIQTIEISIPYINNQKKSVTLIASSIISTQECSLTEPAYFDITSEHG